MAKHQSGICYLTGAGPGDLGLVTLKAREVIEKADVIVYDHLCNPALLDWARPDAERVDAGKRADQHTLPQAAINALLVRKTAEGKIVVRLKGGDPFLFGRGGEEAEVLADEGLPFEIIPGISSALAVPAYAGIPLTHRDHASQVTIFTGHESGEEKPELAVDYAALAKLPGTKVMLMGMRELEAITARLLAEGASPSLPVALIRWGTLGRQQTVTGPLETVAAQAKEAGLTAPVVAVFGEVVTLRETLNWFETKPLYGRRVVVTRSRKQSGALSSRLRELGADTIELPTLRFEPPEDLMAFAELVRDSHTYDWIVFTSPNGVDAFFEVFFKIYRDTREIGGARLAALGESTARRVTAHHLNVDLCPKKATAEELLKEFQKDSSVENLTMLIVRPEKVRHTLAEDLGQLGAIVDQAIAYRTLPETVSEAAAEMRERGADIVTFASSSAVENFRALGLSLPPGAKTASIGPVTSATLKAEGLPVDIEARQHHIEGLIDAILASFRRD